MSFGSVSNTLIELLHASIQQGHKVYTWLDPEGIYKDFVPQFQQSDRKKCQVIIFDGSYLEVMIQIAQILSGFAIPPTIIYLPYHTREQAENTPMLEMLLAGKILTVDFSELLHKAAVGRTSTENVVQFLKKTQSLADANHWLQEEMQENSGQFWTQLHNLSTESALIQALLPTETPEELYIPAQFRVSENQESFWRYVEVQYGLPKNWEPRKLFIATHLPDEIPDFYDLLYVITSWTLVVEFITDLGDIPLPKIFQQIPVMPPNIHNKCSQFAQALRETQPIYYQTLSEDTENEPFIQQLRHTSAIKLGKVDTFSFEERTFFEGAISGITQNEEFIQVKMWAQTRLKQDSFWLQFHGRRDAWRILEKICILGEALQQAPATLPMMNSVDEAAEFYVEYCAKVDQAHRHLEQVVSRLLFSSLTDYIQIKECVQFIRDRYGYWLNEMSRDFTKLCRQHGFLPSDTRQQRNIFYRELKPLCKKGKTAFFMVDALRFEMAQELVERMNLDQTDTISLKPYFCELPSNTNVGMNILAPVVQGGQIELVMSNGKISCPNSPNGFQVRTLEHRRLTIKEAIGGQSSPEISIQEIFESDLTGLRKKFSHSNIAVIPYLGIDKAGEQNDGPNKFPDALRILRKAWEKLRDAGFQHFLFVADHGFLLIDPNPHRAKCLEHGRPIDNNRRHIITEHGTDHPGEVRVRLRDLNYIVDKDYHLLMPEDAKLFETNFSGRNFAHGGNSLQERIIPVLEIIHPAPTKTKHENYHVHIQPLSSSGNQEGLTIRLEQPTLFTESTEVEFHAIDQMTAQVQILQVMGGASFNETKVELRPEKDAHILFRLHGVSGSSRLEVRFPNRGIPSVVTKEYFTVEGKDSMAASQPAEDTVAQEDKSGSSVDWLGNLDDAGVRKVFQYLKDHQVLSESDATNLLGGGRQFRQFKRKFSEYQSLVPFSVRIEVVNGLSQFVRE